ncbi:L-ribulokinase [Chitinophaga ginsengisegetis]|uniref:Ribulokinase n=1 Tax=Chitinophaga ginsengisegetis TaxID=393003 RepID=A0A1T5NAA2_9BACT|nr:ribulokinase [Chitinophaga ginsengisegetis]MDR6568340.1 L-ribulokinase [Chitinophaga ginsengisegetis]MDR6648429.1 L-ribulokinase [Chitinophaga ginsengisegetis]MDR6654421.1 L-ribulokinase [Chitinophaga ginsengisegetis]SKC97405.1 L-ribulokinase [Chitinophaga ginsengisegetis]
MNSSWVIGVDYGTDSVRSIIVDVHNGNEIASAVFYYPRWKDGLYCNAAQSRFRQHPLDYVEGLETTIRQCLQQAGPGAAANIKAISVDTTGSTPVAVDETGTPLALTPAFHDNPNAMFVLWKDHTALKEAAAINATAATFEENYLRFVGGIYSSEWFWAKLLHILRVDETVRNATHSWVEHCDWIPFLLSGGKHISQLKRGVCSAGHKALFAEEFGGLPPDAFFSAIDPLLQGFTQKLFTKTYTSGEAAGHLCPEWAERLGLPTSVVIGIGAFDAHMGAVGGQIEPYHLSKVMGTSTCDMLVAPMEEMKHKLVKGICGQVPGSVIPGMMGMEAGQSAFGDAYAWFSNVLAWPLQHLLPSSSLIDAETAAKLAQETSGRMITELAKQAAQIPPEEHSELGIDWLNGRRTPDADQSLKGTLTGLNLATDAPRIFRTVAESTCFGAKAIVERFEREGVPVKGLIGIGGVAKKSAFIMQMMADVMNMPIRIHRSEQTCALGAAMFAATAAGLFNRVEDAMEAMGQGFEVTYHPDAQRAGIYENRYQKYKALGAFTAAITID